MKTIKAQLIQRINNEKTRFYIGEFNRKKNIMYYKEVAIYDVKNQKIEKFRTTGKKEIGLYTAYILKDCIHREFSERITIEEIF